METSINELTAKINDTNTLVFECNQYLNKKIIALESDVSENMKNLLNIVEMLQKKVNELENRNLCIDNIQDKCHKLLKEAQEQSKLLKDMENDVN